MKYRTRERRLFDERGQSARRQEKHVGTAFVDGAGGVRCSRWEQCIGRGIGLKHCWTLYRRHWSEMHPDTRSLPSVAPAEDQHLFDVEPYTTGSRKRR